MFLSTYGYIHKDTKVTSNETQATTTVTEIKAPTVYEKIHTLSKKYGVPEQVAIDIMRCESKLNPMAVNHQAVVGKDIGYWQLNSYYWEEEMLRLGWDIYNPDDNLEAGFWLYSKQGAQPWSWSAHCHKHY